jgi:hypothetical protein
MDELAGTESMTVAISGRGLTKVTINTMKIQEKAQAARAVYEHAVALGSHFGPYSKPCLDAFLPLVDFKFSSEIRATAAQTLAAVFDSACSYGESTSVDIPTMYLPLLVKAISKQLQEEDTVDMEIVYALADSLSDLLRTTYLFVADFGTSLLANLSQDDLKSVVHCCMEAMASCLERRSQTTSVLAKGPVSGDDERNELKTLLKREEELLTPLVDSVGYALKCFGQGFVPVFEAEVAPVLGSYLGTGNDIRARLSAVCLFDDVIEHCGSAAAEKFGPSLVEGIMNGLNDVTQDSELRRASIYGIAQIARHSPANVLATHAQYFAQQLCLITTCTKEETDDVAMYENAVSALASLVLFDDAPFRSAGFVKRETFVNAFLASLPLLEDADEAMVCHAGLCDLIEHGSIDVDAEHESLVRIIRETLAFVEEGESLASPSTCERLQAILCRLQQNASVDLLPPSFGFANVVSP